MKTDILTELEATARRLPDSIALASQRGSVRYADLIGKIGDAIITARQRGIEPGQTVVVNCSNPDLQMLVGLALVRIGCRVGYNRDMGIYEAGGLAIDVVVSDHPQPAAKYKTVIITPDWFKTGGSSPSLPPPAGDYSIVFATSGSTGTPKLIELSGKALLHRFGDRISDDFYGDRPRVLSVTGPSTLISFKDSLLALTKGGMIIRPPTRHGPAILESMQLFCPNYCAIAPTVLADVVNTLERFPRSVKKMTVVRVAGAYCPPRLRQLALDLVAERLMISYGATEIDRVAVGYSDELAAIDGAVGRVIEGVEVATFDDDGQRLPPGIEGELRVKVPDVIAATYPGTPLPQSTAFKDGWFLTGDIGLVNQDGYLIIRGRALNLINLGGVQVNAEVIEAVIAGLDQVEEVGIVGAEGPDGFPRLCAAVVSAGAIDTDRINAHLNRNNQYVPVQILKAVPTIPKTANGKIDRAALRRLFDDIAG